MGDGAHPRVGVGIVIRRGGELLLQLRSGVHGGGSWSTPGGHLDPGEHPADCAVREAAEETGLRVRDPIFLGVTNDVFAEGLHYVTLWYEARAASRWPTASSPAAPFR